MTTRPVLLVGSLPCENSAEVFRVLAEELGSLAPRYPDGETGDRILWIRWQRHVFDDNPEMTLVEKEGHPGYPEKPLSQPFYALKNGADIDNLAFKKLGYGREAIKSYRIFEDMKRNGKIPSSVKFQVSLPTAVSLLTSFVVKEDRARVETALELAMKTEIDEIVETIPSRELAIQWDVASEIIGHDGGRELHYPDSLSGSVDRIVRHVGFVPVDVEVGIHLCYGDPGHKHVIEPQDTGTCVKFANAICQGAERRVDWIHLPIPRGWDRRDYYAPLQKLALSPATDLYIGLVHFTDGIEGAKRRIELAKDYVPVFGIATECGFGRRDPATVRQLLELHRAASSG